MENLLSFKGSTDRVTNRAVQDVGITLRANYLHFPCPDGRSVEIGVQQIGSRNTFVATNSGSGS